MRVACAPGHLALAVAQVPRHLGRVLVALLERLRQHLGDDVVGELRHGVVHAAWRRRHEVHDLVHERGDVLAVERRRAAQHLVDDHAEGEDVRAVIGALADDLLGRHVLRRAEQHSGLGEVAGAAHAGDAEIGDLHRPVGDHHDVRGLDVTVDHAALVRVGEAFGDLRGNGERLRHAQRPSLADQRAQFHALDVLHRHEHDFACLADVVDRDDVRMVETAGGPRLLVEALLVFVGVLALEADVDRLDRDRSLEHGIERLVYHPHGAAAEFRLDQVAAELRGLHAAAL